MFSVLTELHIENVAVIRRSDIAFGPGLNVLTGETGAGKSIVIDSLGAILGGRVSREIVRTGSAQASVTAVFTPSEQSDAWLADNGIEPEDELIIRRRALGLPRERRARVRGTAQGARRPARRRARPE